MALLHHTLIPSRPEGPYRGTSRAPGDAADLAEMAAFRKGAQGFGDILEGETVRVVHGRPGAEMGHRAVHRLEHGPAADRDALEPDILGHDRPEIERARSPRQHADQADRAARPDGAQRLFQRPAAADFDDTVCGVSATAEGVDGALQRALGDPRADFGSSHFSARLGDSLELKPQAEPVDGVTLVEGFGQRSGERAFSAKFFGAWLDDGAFFVNETTLTVRDVMGRPVGLGTVFDASAMGVASAGAPAPVRGMSATWKGMMIGVDVSDAVTRGQFLRGDATLVVDDLADPDVDVAFGNLRDLETGARLEGRTIAPFENVPLDGASFGAKPVGGGDYIQGRFVGADHAGVVGVFERSKVVGSFGGNRQAGE